MISELLQSVRPAVAQRVWVISDLQQADPAQARHCLQRAVDDFVRLGLPCARIWYLGDAVEGDRPERLAAMAAMQVELLQPLGVPLRFVLGNHDLEYALSTDLATVHVPFHHAVRQVPGWRTTAALSDFYFTEELGDFLIVFLSDHADPAGGWAVAHGAVQACRTAYPHTAEVYAALRAEIAAAGRPALLAAHYAFAGGNRPAALFDQLLPLPPNVRAHFYGHAHIGDAVWAGKDCHRKIAYVDHQPIPQFDVAALENRRGGPVCSAFLEIYRDQTLGIYFRDHERAAWTEALLLPPAG